MRNCGPGWSIEPEVQRAADARRGGGGMTVKEIVRQYLVAHGLDGLAYDECGCRVDDLMPCDTPCDACEVGKLGPCDCGDHDWHIVPVADADIKPAPVGERKEGG